MSYATGAAIFLAICIFVPALTSLFGSPRTYEPVDGRNHGRREGDS